jgi:hypothetical protein
MAKPLIDTKIVSNVLSTMEPDERRVLTETDVDAWFTYFKLWALCFSPQLRFGHRTDHSHVLERIGLKLGYTLGKTTQIEAQALRKLRHPFRFGKLTSILDRYWNGVGSVMENQWTGTAERVFSLYDDHENRKKRLAGHAQYRCLSEAETWGYIVFYVPHQLINLSVPDHVPGSIYVTYSTITSEINETWASSAPPGSLNCSATMQFDYEIKTPHHYYREFQAAGYQSEVCQFRPPADLFDGQEPPRTIFVRLCFSN